MPHAARSSVPRAGAGSGSSGPDWTRPLDEQDIEGPDPDRPERQDERSERGNGRDSAWPGGRDRSARSEPRGAPQGPPPPRPETRAASGAAGSSWFRPSVVNAKLIYAAYLAALAIPLMAVVGVVFAHLARRRSPPAWLMSHYTFQVRTFWIGLAANVVAWVLSFIGIGLLLFPLIAIWLVARAVKGLIRVAQRSEIENPNSFFI